MPHAPFAYCTHFTGPKDYTFQQHRSSLKLDRIYLDKRLEIIQDSQCVHLVDRPLIETSHAPVSWEFTWDTQKMPKPQKDPRFKQRLFFTKDEKKLTSYQKYCQDIFESFYRSIADITESTFDITTAELMLDFITDNLYDSAKTMIREEKPRSFQLAETVRIARQRLGKIKKAVFYGKQVLVFDGDLNGKFARKFSRASRFFHKLLCDSHKLQIPSPPTTNGIETWRTWVEKVDERKRYTRDKLKMLEKQLGLTRKAERDRMREKDVKRWFSTYIRPPGGPKSAKRSVVEKIKKSNGEFTENPEEL